MTKAAIRQHVWELLRRAQAIAFPGPQAGVPNFLQADRAAQLLRELAVWRRAAVVAVSAHVPQLFVRRRAIEDGKLLYIPLPHLHLRTERCFIEIDPRRLGKRSRLAASLTAACRYGRLVAPRDMRPIELVVCGSVAVARDGIRVGTGGGCNDLAYALLREEAKIRESTPIATTVHPLQIVSQRVMMLPHDVPVDFLVTPSNVIATRPAYARPRGIYWELLPPRKINAMAPLRKRLS